MMRRHGFSLPVPGLSKLERRKILWVERLPGPARLTVQPVQKRIREERLLREWARFHCLFGRFAYLPGGLLSERTEKERYH